VEVVADQLDPAAALQLAMHPRVERGTPGLAVLAVAIAVEHLCRDVVAVAAGGAARARAAGQMAVAARGGPQVQAWRGRAGGVPQRDHPAGGIAVRRPGRPAQLLDAVAGGQGEMRDLALAVGHGRRNPVGVQAYAAHAEGRARAETADRKLGVLRAVLAV